MRPGTIEIAMTHRAGLAGAAERCLRPKVVRDIATRVQKWAVAPEVCKSCSNLPAVRYVEGLAMCGRCHTQRAERYGRRDGESLLPSVQTRADQPSPTGKRLEGYAIRFNEKSVELYGFFEIIRPAAADRMVSEKPDLRALWNHDSSQPIGRSTAGTLRYEKRSKGIFVEIDPPAWAAGYVESVDRRDVTGMSFGFMALEDDWWLEDGMPHREILDMEVIEVSGVSFPAYPTTSIKAINASQRSELGREHETAQRLRMVR